MCPSEILVQESVTVYRPSAIFGAEQCMCDEMTSAATR